MSPWHVADALFAIKGGVPERLCNRLKVNVTLVRHAVHAKAVSLSQQVRYRGESSRGGAGVSLATRVSSSQRRLACRL